jgi:hypothetical protein
VRSVNFDSKGRESINSLEDTLLRNSRSGFTDASISTPVTSNKLSGKLSVGANSFNTFNGHSNTISISNNTTASNNGSSTTQSNTTSCSNKLGHQTNSSTKNSHTNISNTSNHNSHSNIMDSTDTLSRNQRETLHSRFDFIRILGKGTYGKVKLANDKRTGKQVNIYVIFLFLYFLICDELLNNIGLID